MLANEHNSYLLSLFDYLGKVVAKLESLILRDVLRSATNGAKTKHACLTAIN